MSSVHIAVPGTRSDSLYEGFPTVHGTRPAHAYTHVHTLVYMHLGVHDLSSSMRHGTIATPLRAWRFEKSTMYVPARRATRPGRRPTPVWIHAHVGGRHPGRVLAWRRSDSAYLGQGVLEPRIGDAGRAPHGPSSSEVADGEGRWRVTDPRIASECFR